MRTMFITILSGVMAAGAFVLAAGAEESEGATSCLTAAAEGDHETAVTVCTEALKEDPENEEVKKALETAKSALEKGDETTPPASSEEN
jgi:hypothetical protein